jgi:hypothetical protein
MPADEVRRLLLSTDPDRTPDVMGLSHAESGGA